MCWRETRRKHSLSHNLNLWKLLMFIRYENPAHPKIMIWMFSLNMFTLMPIIWLLTLFWIRHDFYYVGMHNIIFIIPVNMSQSPMTHITSMTPKVRRSQQNRLIQNIPEYIHEKHEQNISLLSISYLNCHLSPNVTKRHDVLASCDVAIPRFSAATRINILIIMFFFILDPVQQNKSICFQTV